jgi:hypothetical protein
MALLLLQQRMLLLQQRMLLLQQRILSWTSGRVVQLALLEFVARSNAEPVTRVLQQLGMEQEGEGRTCSVVLHEPCGACCSVLVFVAVCCGRFVLRVKDS